jgi:hypothetical protein
MSGEPGEDIDPAVICDAAVPVTSWPDRPLRHTYKLSRRGGGLRQTLSIMRPTLPYAAARLAWLLLYSIATLGCMGLMLGGSTWLRGQGTSLAAGLWCATCVLAQALLWQRLLRNALSVIACGQVAVMTQVMTSGCIHNGPVGMLTFGRRLVTRRFGGAGVLHDLQDLQSICRGVVRSFHATLGWLDDVLPRPWWIRGGLRRALLRWATNYLVMAVLSYDFARQDAEPLRGIKDGLVYYCQNAKPMLLICARIVVLDVLLTFGLFLLALMPGFLLGAFLNPAGAAILALALLLLSASLRAAFVKPALLVIVLTRFHALAEGQVINPAWDERLTQISEKYRSLWRHTARPSP